MLLFIEMHGFFIRNFCVLLVHQTLQVEEQTRVWPFAESLGSDRVWLMAIDVLLSNRLSTTAWLWSFQLSVSLFLSVSHSYCCIFAHFLVISQSHADGLKIFVDDITMLVQTRTTSSYTRKHNRVWLGRSSYARKSWHFGHFRHFWKFDIFENFGHFWKF